VQTLDGIRNRHDARGAPRLARIALIIAYGATIRAAGRWEHEVVGRPIRAMSCELALVAGRPCDPPGCAASADP